MGILLSRRNFIKVATAAGMQLPLWRMRAAKAAQEAGTNALGPFKPTWESLVQTTSPHIGGRKVKEVTIVGGSKLEWKQGERGLSVKLPESLPGMEAVGLRIKGVV